MAEIKYFKGNLFKHDSIYERGVALAHCISADYKLGAGIAVDFNSLYDMRNKLLKVGKHQFPDCIYIDNVFNLVTKNKYNDKPTWGTMNAAIEMMAKQAYELDIQKIVTYKLGCTRDKMKWEEVESMLREHILPLDIEIEIYEI